MKRYLLKSSFFAVLLFSLSAGSASAQVSAQTPVPDADRLRIFYYRDNLNARASLALNAASIDVLAPQSYNVNIYGKLTGSVDPVVMEIAKAYKLKVMPLLTNGSFDQRSLIAVMDHPQKQDEIIQEMVREAKKNGYWGWQIDFEQMDLYYRDKFSAFIRKFGAEMKRNGLKSSVAVIAQVSENPADYKNNLWQNLIGVYDYKALSDATDFLSLMSYDDPESKGPVARYDWLTRIISYSLTKAPSRKLSLGIPLYYWKWDDDRQKLVDIGGFASILNVMKRFSLAAGFSAPEKAAFFKYSDNGKNYTIWYENEESIGKKLELISTNNLHGFSAWALGQESPDVHTAFAGFKKVVGN